MTYFQQSAKISSRQNFRLYGMFDSILAVLGKDFENNILLRPLFTARNSAAMLWMIDEQRVEKSYDELKKH